MSVGAAVELQDVSFHYGAQVVLDGVSLGIGVGHFHSLIGPSGCGKSTLLRIVAGLLAPAAGTVHVDGQPPVHRGGQQADIGLIFQEPTLMPWLTVCDNIALPLRLRGADHATRTIKASALAGQVGLAGFLDYYPRQLSGGMRMRVSLARALALSPRLMLLDEPFAGLDAIRRDALNEELLAVQQREGWTALLVTHAVPEAVFLSHRVYVMGTGPGRVMAAIDIPLPFPRTAAMRGGREFLALVGRVTDALREAAARP